MQCAHHYGARRDQTRRALFVGISNISRSSAVGQVLADRDHHTGQRIEGRRQNVALKFARSVWSVTPEPDWLLNEIPKTASRATLKSSPTSVTTASCAIGTPAMVNALPPLAKASADSGVVSPKACRQPSDRRGTSALEKISGNPCAEASRRYLSVSILEMR
jgi:hypothetical protein